MIAATKPRFKSVKRKAAWVIKKKYFIDKTAMRLISFLLVLPFCHHDIAAQKTHKAIFVIADGIPADVIERLKPPALGAITKEGGYAEAYVGGEKNG